MLKMTTNRSAKNLSVSDMAENAEVGSKTSSTTRSAKNLLLDIAENAEVGSNGHGNDNETVKKSPFKKLNGPTS